MKEYSYLIVGGGMAADAAVRGIREEDPDGSIAVLTREPHPPYRRPPLSKELWTNHLPLAEIHCDTASEHVDIFTGRTVQSVNRQEKTVCDQEEQFRYQKLLLATGGSPKTLPFPMEERVVYYRTLDDFCAVKKIAETADRMAVVGGSFIGCEMAAALLSAGKKVTMIFPEEAPFRQIFPEALSAGLLQLFDKEGAEMIAGVKLSNLRCDSGQCLLVLENGQNLEVGAVVAGVGIEPNAGLAESAGLKTGDGIDVNRQLQTSDPDIYAAGDIASFYNPALNRRLRVEHEDHALKSGKTAGRNMAGQTLEYNHLPFFYSGFLGVSCEAVGILDSSLQTEGIWHGVQEKGVWAYLENRRVCGVLMWNLSGKADWARALIAETRPLDENTLKLRLAGLMA